MRQGLQKWITFLFLLWSPDAGAGHQEFFLELSQCLRAQEPRWVVILSDGTKKLGKVVTDAQGVPKIANPHSPTIEFYEIKNRSDGTIASEKILIPTSSLSPRNVSIATVGTPEGPISLLDDTQYVSLPGLSAETPQVGRVKRIFHTPDKGIQLEVEQYAQGKKTTQVYSSSQVKPDPKRAEVFRAQEEGARKARFPYSGIKNEETISVRSVETKGVKNVIIHDLKDREEMLRAGKIMERARLSELPAGSYNYVVTEDGQLTIGKVDNILEYGVKHFQLANGKAVLAAGEIEIEKTGHFMFNLESGTYFSELLIKMPQKKTQRGAHENV